MDVVKALFSTQYRKCSSNSNVWANATRKQFIKWNQIGFVILGGTLFRGTGMHDLVFICKGSRLTRTSAQEETDGRIIASATVFKPLHSFSCSFSFCSIFLLLTSLWLLLLYFSPFEMKAKERERTMQSFWNVFNFIPKSKLIDVSLKDEKWRAAEKKRNASYQRRSCKIVRIFAFHLKLLRARIYAVVWAFSSQMMPICTLKLQSNVCQLNTNMCWVCNLYGFFFVSSDMYWPLLHWMSLRNGKKQFLCKTQLAVNSIQTEKLCVIFFLLSSKFARLENLKWNGTKCGRIALGFCIFE